MAGFSELIAAVPARKRTERLKILAALYVLDAQAAPALAREVNELLKLHFRGAAPANVNAALRKYSAYIEPTQTKPLRWRLTRAGVELLQELTGRSLAHEQTFRSDIGIVCALEHPEFAAVQDALGGPAVWKEVGSASFAHVYKETQLVTVAGKSLRIVGTTASSMGLTAAAIVTTQLVLQFRPRLVIMVGIAAGTRQGGKEFGDVLVADPSVDYSSGKVVRKDGIRDFQPDPYPLGLNPRLRALLQKYRTSHQVFREIRNRWEGKYPRSANKLHLGPLGAADQVIDDASRVLEIQQNWRKLIGVEMETYGVYRACYEAPEPKPRFVSFKAVCDFAAEKSDSWQSFAAFMAAEFTAKFLSTEWEGLWPGPSDET